MISSFISPNLSVNFHFQDAGQRLKENIKRKKKTTFSCTKNIFFLNRIRQMNIFIMKGQAETEDQTLHDEQWILGTKLRKLKEE